MNIKLIDILEPEKLNKKLKYAFLYSGYKALIETIDEEGSGSVFAAIIYDF